MDIYFALVYCYINNTKEIGVTTIKRLIGSKEKGREVFRKSLNNLIELNLLHFFNKVELQERSGYVRLEQNSNDYHLFFTYDRYNAVGFELEKVAEIRHKNEKRLYLFLLMYMREGLVNINIDKLKSICYLNKKNIRTTRFQLKEDIEKIRPYFIDFKETYYYVNNTERIRFEWNVSDTLTRDRTRLNYLNVYMKEKSELWK